MTVTKKSSVIAGILVPAFVALHLSSSADPTGTPTPQATTTVIHANFYLSPAPRAALGQWTSAPGRRAVSLDVGAAVLRGWTYAARDRNAPTVLVFGGDGYGIVSVDSMLRELASQGASIVEYDYRGFGFSGGKADVFDMRSDALRLYDATVKRQGGRSAVVFGYSLGSIFASYVASVRNVRALVLVSPLASSAAEIGYLMKPGTYRIAPDSAEAEDVVGFVSRSRAPLLVAHGTADRMIPIEQGEAVFANSRASTKFFVAVPGAGHDALFVNPRVLTAFKKFLRLRQVRRTSRSGP